MVAVEVLVDDMELNVEEFKHHTEIKVDWPIFGDCDQVEVVENHIENGLFVMQSKDIEVNNRHLLVEVW